MSFKDDSTSGDAPFSYQWNFGDGTDNATIQNPTHQYAAVGNYTVTLTIRDASGDVSVYQSVIVVKQDWTWIAISIIAVCVGITGIIVVIRKWGRLIARNIINKIKKSWSIGSLRLKKIGKMKHALFLTLVICVGFGIFFSLEPVNYALADTSTDITRADGKLDFSQGMKQIVFVSDTLPQNDTTWMLDGQIEIASVSSSFFIGFFFTMTFGGWNISYGYYLMSDDYEPLNGSSIISINSIIAWRNDRISSYLIEQTYRFHLNLTEIIYSVCRDIVPSDYSEMCLIGNYMDPQVVQDPRNGYSPIFKEVCSGNYAVLRIETGFSDVVVLDSLSVTFSNSLHSVNFSLLFGITMGGFLGAVLVQYGIYYKIKRVRISDLTRTRDIKPEIIEIPFDASDVALRPRGNVCTYCWQPVDDLICPHCGKVNHSKERR
ncbi:MAG: fibronectin type III domain-containing protein [Promethearchaeota archaeon CR_4]|nr:MAG: fibronectin type III domain-containing protein [Candidatus Lokiarchaeota archaeon CR_4]